MLRDLFKDRNKDTLKLLALLEETGDEELLERACDSLMNGHLCEKSAKNKVKRMQPVNIHKSMIDFMEEMNINGVNALELVKKEEEKAHTMYGNAPHLPSDTTTWDCYYCIAMAFSDYWITVGHDKEKAVEFAYQYLSDPDKK